MHALEVATANQKKEIDTLISTNPTDKVEKMLTIYKDCKVDEWAKELKEKYYKTALKNLADIAVLAIRKKPLYELAIYLMERES